MLLLHQDQLSLSVQCIIQLFRIRQLLRTYWHMNKWEDLLKHKIHNSRIKGAKSIVYQNNDSHLYIRNNVSSQLGQSSLINSLKNTLDLSQILKKHGLQQYSRQLTLKGYLDAPNKLRELIQSDRLTTVDQEIKLLPGHKTKLITMLSSIEALQEGRTGVKLPQLKLPIQRLQYSVSRSQHRSIKASPLVSKLSEAREESYRGQTKVVRSNRQSYKIIISSSSSKNLKPAIKRGMAKLIKSRKNDQAVNLGYTEQLTTYRSIDGAKFHSSLHNIDLSQIVECMALYVIANLQIISRSKPKKSKVEDDRDLFNRVKPRINQPEDDLTVIEQINDFGCFEQYNDQSPEHSSVGNYIKNILTGARIEPSVIPAAVVILNRLRNCSKRIVLTNLTYQKIVLCSLIIAGKICTDSFLSRPINIGSFMPSHSRITQAERLFLSEIDYELSISPKEYAQSYFNLRGFIRRDKATLKQTNVSKRYGAVEQSLKRATEISKDPHRIIKHYIKRRSF